MRDSEAVDALAAELKHVDRVDLVGDATLRRALPDRGADAGVVALLTEGGEELEVVASLGYPVEACMGPGRRWAAVSTIPIAESVRTDRTIQIGSPREWADRYGMTYVPQSSSRAWAAVPLRRRGRPVGALLWTYHEPRAFGGADLRAMEGFAAAASEALDRVLYGSD